MFAYLILVNFLLLWSPSQACKPNETCDIDTNDPNIQNLLASMDYFTTQLVQKLYNPQDPTASLGVVSPMSIYVSLVLMLFGSAGNTQKELIEALHFPDADLQQLQNSFRDILVATDTKHSIIIGDVEDVASDGHVAEGLFIQNGFTLVKEYADYLGSLNIQIHPVDFLNTEATMTAIYNWIDENTPKSGSTSESYSSTDSTKIYSTSLPYFTAKWEKNLFLDKKVERAPFYTLQNKTIYVQMMKASVSLLYYEKQGSFSAVQVPYEANDFTAIFILPDKKVNAVEFVTSFSTDILHDFFLKAQPKDVDCQIPTFSYSYSLGLNGLLEELGIKELFGEADLSRMLAVPKQNLGVQISHNAGIEVNQKGTTADGLTVVPVGKAPPPTDLIPFIADRPFLMFVRSSHTSAILFATFFYGY